MANPASNDLLTALVPEWHRLLQGWAADGRLTAAAQEALMLNEEPQQLKELITQWASGDFSGLPPIVLLTSGDIRGALGAYAISTRTIYLNADWLEVASRDQILAVLTEELGHHLDGLLNGVDTPGDEGEEFSQQLLNTKTLSDQQLPGSSDEGIIFIDGYRFNAEFARVPRDLANDISGTRISTLQNSFDSYYSTNVVVGTSSTNDILSTTFSASLAESYRTPLGFDVWSVWTSPSKITYKSIIGLGIEGINFNGTIVSNNNNTPTNVWQPDNSRTYGFKASSGDDLVMLNPDIESSYQRFGKDDFFVATGGAGQNSLFIPYTQANHVSIQQNDLGLHRVQYVQDDITNADLILNGFQNISYVDSKYRTYSSITYNLVNCIPGSNFSYRINQASENPIFGFEGTSLDGSPNGTTGNDLMIASVPYNGELQQTIYTSFNGSAGADILLFGSFTSSQLTNLTRSGQNQWSFTLGGLTITANNIENLQFRDGAVKLHPNGTITNIPWIELPSGLYLGADTAQLLYVAYYGRPADVNGLKFWMDKIYESGFTYAPRLGDGLDSTEKSLYDRIVVDFGNSIESQRLYEGKSAKQSADIVYNYCFGRDSEIDPVTGINYWVDKLEKKEITLSQLAAEVALGAQGGDLTYIQNKIASANAFYNALDLPFEEVGYGGASDGILARNWLAQFGPTFATDIQAEQIVTTIVANP